MAKSTATASELARLVDQLRAERQDHVEAIARIDETFTRFGIELEGAAAAPAKRGRKKTTKKKVGKKKVTKKAGKKKVTKKAKAPAAKKKTTRKRQTFAQTGEESVLSFVKQAGSPNAAEVNAHWTQEGRGGKADNTLGKLVKEGKLKRVSVKGERGARYKAA